MSDEKLPPLSPRASRLIEAERGRADEPSDRVDRIFERFATSVAIGASAPVHAAGVKGAVHGASVLSKKTAALVLAAFVAGGGTGAAVHARWMSTRQGPRPGASAMPATARTASEVQSPAPPTESAPPASVPAGVVPTARPSAARSAEPLGERDVDLSRERALIDRARMARARQAPLDELAALEEHARLFPTGRLAEEREGLAVGTLVDLGRTVEAQQRALLFKRRFPNSVLLPAVDAMLNRATAPKK